MSEEMMGRTPITTPAQSTSEAHRAHDGERSPAVTVIIPPWERPELLREALQSALRQTYRDFVVLIGDNSETDLIEEVVQGLKIFAFYHRGEPPVSPQRNWLELAERARSTLVASLHDDDVRDLEFLAETVPGMLADQIDSMTFTDFWMIDESSRRLRQESLRLSSWTGYSTLPPARLETSLLDGATPRVDPERSAACVRGCTPSR